MRSFFLMCVAAAVLAPQACVGDDPSVGPGGNEVDAGDGDEGRRDGSVITSPDAGTPVRGLSLTAASFEIVRGGSAQLTVKLAWEGEPTAVSLTWAALKPGMDGGTPTIVAAGVTEQVLSLSATEAAAVGDTMVQIVATTGSSPDERTVVDVPLLVRGTPGSLDTSFGTNGNIQLPPAPYGAMTMTRDPSGRLIVTGQTERSADKESEGMVMARYLPNGMLDAAFADGGVAKWTSPYSGYRPISSVSQLDLSTVTSGDKYTTALAYWGGLQSVAGVSSVSANGTVATLPPTAGGAILYAGTAVPQGAGSWILASECFGKKLDAAGAAIGQTQPLAPEPRTDHGICSSRALAASDTHLVFSVGVSKQSDIWTSAWSGLAVVDRDTGNVTGNVATAYNSSAGLTALPGGGFAGMLKSRLAVRMDAVGRGAATPNDLDLPEDARTAAFAFHDGTVGIIATTRPNHTTQLHVLASSGQRTGQPLTLPSFDVAEIGTGLEGSAYQAFVDDQRRLVVFYRVPYGYVSSTTEPNPHWLIRRYWL